MTGTARAGAAGQRRAVFAVDEEAALAALEEAWADGGYHAFGVEDPLQPIIPACHAARRQALTPRLRSHKTIEVRM